MWDEIYKYLINYKFNKHYLKEYMYILKKLNCYLKNYFISHDLD